MFYYDRKKTKTKQGITKPFISFDNTKFFLFQAKDPLHFDSTLEIVCEVDPLAVPPALLSNKHFVLQANIQGKLSRGGGCPSHRPSFFKFPSVFHFWPYLDPRRHYRVNPDCNILNPFFNPYLDVLVLILTCIFRWWWWFTNVYGGGV